MRYRSAILVPGRKQPWTEEANQQHHHMKLTPYCLSLLTAAAAVFDATAPVHAADKKPNIVVIWGDDIGYWNINAYNQGMMGYKTLNIDRIAKQGALFSDWYGQPSE